ncbi:MAG: tetratricopeptide repeat protein [Geminicoccaceae bacterium]
MCLLRHAGRAACLLAALALAGCTAPFEAARLPNPPSGDAALAGKSPAQRWIAMGDDALAAGDTAAAAGFYQEAAGVAANDPEALQRLGRAFEKAGRWQDAADVYKRLLDLGATDAATGRGYARAMLALGQPAAAKAHLEAALAGTPDDPAVLNLLGVANDMLGNPATAQEAYRRGLAAAPGDPSLLNNLGLSQALAGDHAAALATLEPLANGTGSTPRARQNLALAYALKGDMAAAERIGLIDLDAASVRANLRYVGTLKGTGDKAEMASGLLTDVATEAPPARPRTRVPSAAAEAPAGDPGGRSATTGPGGPTPLVPSPAAPVAAAADPHGPATQALPLPALPHLVAAPMPIGELPVVPAEVALTPAEMAAGLPPIGSWLIDLGAYPDPAAAGAAWQKLRAAHPDLLQGLTRMAGAGGGSQPLLLGPLASEAEADRLCAGLTARSVTCGKLKI